MSSFQQITTAVQAIGISGNKAFIICLIILLLAGLIFLTRDISVIGDTFSFTVD